jgi:prepilin-type N-terminal cleavage/methylation domain-containing protein
MKGEGRMPNGDLESSKGQGSTINSRDPTDRRGMTLFEILLVLVLLVVVGSLAAPLFDGGFATLRLRRGADQIQAAWTEARVQAIQTGRIHQFVFQPSSGNYRVATWQVDELSDAEADQLPAADPNQSVQSVWQPYQAQLPEEIQFAEGEAAILDAVGQRTVEKLNQTDGAAWSAPILFFPDGSTSAASLVLKNEKRLFQRVTSRALTGVARVSEVLTEDELKRLQSL